ncbi:MAG: tetratricopeptide repeat protein [Treponema sp.]|nr:tetratricopeptide repeat protein [Treponema sp.]
MNNKKSRIFICFAFIGFFVFAASINAQQQEYNPITLEHFRKSLEYMSNGDYRGAINSSTIVIGRDPRSSIAYVIRARAYYELDEYDKAIADCTQAIREDRQNAGAFVIRGNAYAQKGDRKRAITDWESALRINPKITEATRNIEVARDNLQ